MRILTFILALLTFGMVHAQKDMETKGVDMDFSRQSPSEGLQDMSLGDHTAFSLVLDDADDKLVMEVWKDFLKQYGGKTRKVKRSSELYTDDAQASVLGPNPVDIYSLVDGKGSGSVLSIWVDAGGSFVNSEDNPDGADGVEFLLDEFQKSLHVRQVENELKEQEKELKDRERMLAKLEAANDKLHRQIADWQDKIAKAEGDIEVNVTEQADAEQLIQDQKDLLHQIEVKLAKAKAQ